MNRFEVTMKIVEFGLLKSQVMKIIQSKESREEKRKQLVPLKKQLTEIKTWLNS